MEVLKQEVKLQTGSGVAKLVRTLVFALLWFLLEWSANIKAQKVFYRLSVVY